MLGDLYVNIARNPSLVLVLSVVYPDKCANFLTDCYIHFSCKNANLELNTLEIDKLTFFP